VSGKENPIIKTLWEHIPAPGKEIKAEGVKINPMDLLPADRSFYRFPGSLTTPICNEVVAWYVMKNAIELSEVQITEYTKHYHNTARPLQPLTSIACLILCLRPQVSVLPPSDALNSHEPFSGGILDVTTRGTANDRAGTQY